MTFLRWAAKRRFNHIDGMANISTVFLAINGRWGLAVAAWLIGSAISLVVRTVVESR